MKKRALISVWDKTGISDFAKKLSKDFNYEIVSTGSTAALLKENGIEVIEVKEVTGFDEMLGGKVKTLHPAIHASILADITLDSEAKELEQKGFSPISIVAVNLYPFKDIASKTADEKELIKNIDIGGVTLLRAAAKNNKNVLAISSPGQYKETVEELKKHNGNFSPELAKKYAQQAFETTSDYDTLISNTFAKIYEIESNSFKLNAQKLTDLRYGENPHQNAAIFKTDKMLDYEVLQGKELSYNNILDATAALNIAAEFYDVPACAIIKHNTPSGVALGKDSLDAYLKALDCDPVSAFGGITAFSKSVDENTAKQLVSLFLEVVIAPDFSKEALEILSEKKNLRVIKLNTPLEEYGDFSSKEIKLTPFGALVQDADKKGLEKDLFKAVSKEKPTAEMIEDMIFAWKVCKHVKSNAIVIAKDFKTLGICGGQTSRVDAVEIALNKACDGSKDAVLASDGFFPAVDNINAAAQGRIKAIIQPGGSIKDNEVIAQADKYDMIMITTGIRHFKH